MTPQRSRFRLGAIAFLVVTVGAAGAVAQERRPYQHALAYEIEPDNFGITNLLVYRFRTSKGPQIGLEAGGGYGRRVFIAGFAGEDARIFRSRLTVLAPVWQVEGLTFALEVKAGVRRTWDAEPLEGSVPGSLPNTSSTATEFELGLLSYVEFDPRLLLRVGVVSPVSVQLDPEITNDVAGVLLTAGVHGRVGRRWWLFGELTSGGIFGSDGDAGKFLVGGTLGARVVFGREPEDWRVF